MGGGVIIFTETSKSPCVCALESSSEDERIWAVLHTNQGPHLIGAWYRPPGSGIQNIMRLHTEWLRHSVGMNGTIIVGDMNVHSIRWLKFSSRETPEGSSLWQTCAAMGLKQLVQEPTRGEHLLDLVLSDTLDSTITTLGHIADHRGILMSVHMKVPEQIRAERTLWHFGAADWEKMRDQTAETDWSSLTELSADAGAIMLTDTVLAAMSDCIPKKKSLELKSSHPWLSAIAEAAVQNKHFAQETEQETEAAQICSAVLVEELQKHRFAVRTKLTGVSFGNKKWWKMKKMSWS